MKNIRFSPNMILKPISRLIGRYHMTLFIVFIVAGLTSSVLFLNAILTNAASDDYTSPIDAGSIDRATLDRLKALHTSDVSSAAPKLPSGRVNPFGE